MTHCRQSGCGSQVQQPRSQRLQRPMPRKDGQQRKRMQGQGQQKMPWRWRQHRQKMPRAWRMQLVQRMTKSELRHHRREARAWYRCIGRLPLRLPRRRRLLVSGNHCWVETSAVT